MARRERERYTERKRPQRQEAGEGGGAAPGPSSIKNPAVIVAIAGLVIAGVMLLGFLYGRGTPSTDTAAGTTPTAEAATTPTIAVDNLPPTTPDATEVGAAPDAAVGKYTAPEDQKLDAAGKAYFATIETAYGPIKMELWPEIAPQHVNSLVFLAREGYFDGLTFHRVEPGFVIQGGDPAGTGSGGPGYNIPGEFNADNPVPHRVGTLAMARTGGDPNSAGSQFYIVLADGQSATGLDGQYTNFGHVISGMDAVRQVKVGDVMTKVTIEEAPKSESVVSPDAIRNGELPEGVE